MRNIFILLLAGLALLQLAGANLLDEENQISLLENQVDLQYQQLADPKKKKNKSARRKKKGRKTKRKKNRKGKKKRGKKLSRRNRRKGRGKNKRNGKKRSNRKNKRGKKKRGRKSRRPNLRNRQSNATEGGSSAGGCETGCSELMVGMMKAARKQNTYLKQFNRIINGQKQSKKKGLKKSDFGSNATDGPLNLLLTAGGGNKSELTCAGSKTNKAALLMANLTAKLAACETDLASKCNISKFATIKPEWTACNTTMLEFKTESDNCMKKSGVAVCTCFNTTKVLDIKKKVDNCSGTEMQKASVADGKLKKTCKDTYGACRQGGESIRPVLSACQPGGKTESEMKAELGNTLKNEAATDAVTAAIDKKIAAAGRKTSKVRRSVTFGGTTYALDTCANWATAVSAWLDALVSSLTTDVSSYGTTIAGTEVTCTAADVAALNSAKSKATAVKSKIAKKKSMLQATLEKTTGSTASAADAQSAAASAGGGSDAAAVTKASRRRHKILAEFRQRF